MAPVLWSDFCSYYFFTPHTYLYRYPKFEPMEKLKYRAYYNIMCAAVVVCSIFRFNTTHRQTNGGQVYLAVPGHSEPFFNKVFKGAG